MENAATQGDELMKGLPDLMLDCDENGIRFSPALMVTSEEIDTSLSIIRGVLQDISSI